jgi:hypothetical protein
MNIEFIPRSNDVSQILSPPKPSKFYMPDWFKDMPPTLPSFDTGKMDGTAKKCMPFLDSLTSGYTQELICDVSIKNHGTDKQTGYDIISYKYAGDIRPLSTRLEDTKSRHVFPNFEGYYDTEFHWDTLWEPKTPPGYSTFYYHPANRFDLPFQTMNGIIDTDKWFMSGPLPFLIKRGFEGIIPAGTPIYQMIFIKRDSWNSSSMEYDESFNKKKEYSVRKFFKDGYKKQHWSRKEYS